MQQHIYTLYIYAIPHIDISFITKEFALLGEGRVGKGAEGGGGVR